MFLKQIKTSHRVTNAPKALSRLPPREAYDRAHRIRLASQCSVLHKILPKEQWVKPSEVWPFPLLLSSGFLMEPQDVRYLKPYVTEVVQQNEERRVWDTMQVEQKHH